MSGAGPARVAVDALRGAVGFLTRVPARAGEAEWDAFRRAPWTFPPVGLLVGSLAGAAFLLPVPVPTTAAGYLVALYLVTGVTHPDGLADLGDAVAAHDPERAREVLADAGTGVGGALALGVTLVALALGALGLAGAGAAVAFRLALAAEVGAKLAMALLVCYGRPAHEGLGSQLVGEVSGRAFGPALVVALPVLLFPPTGAAAGLVAALLAGPAVGFVLLVWTDRWLGGVSGDVVGAGNELARAVALHAGVVGWTLL